MIELPYSYNERIEFLREITNLKDHPHLEKWVEWVASEPHFFYYSDLPIIYFEDHSETVNSYHIDFYHRAFIDRFRHGQIFILYKILGQNNASWIRGLFLEDSDIISKLRIINIDRIF
jgi:hypothetical protein